MTKYSHLVITYNHDTGKFDYDVDTTLSKFSDGTIWDDIEQEWGWAKNSTDTRHDSDALEELVKIFMAYNES